jgi:RimJ/RimL family protein N-acetyltransferase
MSNTHRIGKIGIAMNLIGDLSLEPARTDNAAIIFPYVVEKSNYQFTEDEPPTLVEHMRRHHFAGLNRSPDNPDMIWLYWLAKLDNEYVGTVEIGIFPSECHAEIGYVTFQPFRNKGLAAAFCRMAIAEFQMRFSKIPLQGSVNELNSASVQVLQSLGFELKERNLKTESINGVLTDELVYTLKPL